MGISETGTPIKNVPGLDLELSAHLTEAEFGLHVDPELLDLGLFQKHLLATRICFLRGLPCLVSVGEEVPRPPPPTHTLDVPGLVGRGKQGNPTVTQRRERIV